MSKNESTTLSPRDLELLAAAMQCTKGGEITIDYAKFATKGGFKNANSAKASWHGLKKKLEKASGEGGVEAATPPATPGGTDTSSLASGKKRKAAAKNGEEDGVEGTPTKAKAKRGRKPMKTESEPELEAADVVPSVEGKGDDEAAIKTEDDDAVA